ncbi:MAG TPA: DUF3560 domain-containing protein [Ktedonobacterales bacterium]|nr:DUF3560 domain-containing protein [Ktedonobacterales bacterium]
MSSEQTPRFDDPRPNGEQGGSPNLQPDQQTDLWGNPVEAPRQRNRKGKNDVVYVGKLAVQKMRLFSSAEMQIPFPAEPVNKSSDEPDDSIQPDTLFYTPDPASPYGQDELFTAPPEPTFDTQTLPPTTDAQEANESIRLPVDPDVGDLPDDLRDFVTYIPLHLLSEQQRKGGILPLIATRFYIYRSTGRGYVPGIVLVSEEDETKRELMSYGVTQRPGDITAAYEKIQQVIVVQGLRQPAAASSQETPPPEPLPTATETALEPAQAVETEQSPLLTILHEDELYFDPNEVTIEEAEENDYPLLRRDVVTYRWWLDLPFDTREQPELYEALKATKWRWGGYRRQWFNQEHFPTMPEGMPYANAGPAYYSEENAGRLEARATRARATSTEHQQRADKMASIIPFGQPMLRDHYSYRADLNYRKKIWHQMDLFVAFYKKAEWLEARAEGSQRLQRRGSNVHAMNNRMQRLQADLRSLRRGYDEAKRKQATGEYDYYRRRLTILATEILPLQVGIAERGGLPSDRLDPHPGDYVKIRERAEYVVKVNKTTIVTAHPTLTLANGQPWQSTYKITDLQEILATREELEARKQQEGQPN